MTHPASLRREAKTLRASGKSQRAIAAALGVSQATVWTWLGGKAGREYQRKKNARYSVNLVGESIYLGGIESDPADQRRGHVQLFWYLNLRTRRRIGFTWNFHHYEEGDRQSGHGLPFRKWNGKGIVFPDEAHRDRYLAMFEDGVLIREVPV